MQQTNSSQSSAIWSLAGSTLLAFVLVILNRYLGYALETLAASNGGVGIQLPPLHSIPAELLGVVYLASILGCLLVMARSLDGIR